MENPKQTFYAPEELFALKPEPIKIAAVKPATPPVVVSNEIPAVVVQPYTSTLNFWSKYKAYIIGGTILLGCIGLFFYSENKKVKKSVEEN